MFGFRFANLSKFGDTRRNTTFKINPVTILQTCKTLSNSNARYRTIGGEQRFLKFRKRCARYFEMSKWRKRKCSNSPFLGPSWCRVVFRRCSIKFRGEKALLLIGRSKSKGKKIQESCETRLVPRDINEILRIGGPFKYLTAISNFALYIPTFSRRWFVDPIILLKAVSDRYEYITKPLAIRSQESEPEISKIA